MTALPGELPEGWHPCDAAAAEGLHAELQRELPPGHLLYRVPVDVVAGRGGTDDILCRHCNKPTRFTVIHLTWIARQEIDPRFPFVEDDGDFESFLRYEAGFGEPDV